jgi:hypothetical protein
MRTLLSIVVVTFSFNAAGTPVYAQVSHAALQSILDSAVQDHVTKEASDRETVQRLLERPEVESMAKDFGVDLRRAQSAVSMLDAEQLAAAAAQARQAEKGLAGGQSSITISTTMIIIGLLILILIIVIA